MKNVLFFLRLPLVCSLPKSSICLIRVLCTLLIYLSISYVASVAAIEHEEISLINTDSAKIILLNKITAKSTTEILQLGQKHVFGNLSIELKQCTKSVEPTEYDNFILLTIKDTKNMQENTLFNGWLVSSNPSISTVEHPVYEIIAQECIQHKKK